MSPIRFFELTGRADNIRFSPYCWRIRMSLLHKGLDFEGIPWRFTEKERLAETGYDRVPVLQHGGKWIPDSLQIARYLDATFPERPLFPQGAASRANASFLGAWCDQEIHQRLSLHIVYEVFLATHEKDKAYYRETREKRQGRTLEACAAAAADVSEILKLTLRPVEVALAETAFLGGDAPDYCDYTVFGSLQWANVVSRKDPLDRTSPAGRWFERMLDQFDGGARKLSTVRDRH